MFAGGWFWLLSGSSTDVGIGRSIVNIHSLTMALGLIVSGVGLILAGMVGACFGRLSVGVDVSTSVPSSAEVPMHVRHAIMEKEETEKWGN